MTGIDPYVLGAMVGRQLPFFSLIVPFWLIWAFAGFRGMRQVWPAVLLCGVSFAVPQFLISNYVNPWIVDIGASLISMACLILFFRFGIPRRFWFRRSFARMTFSGDDAGTRSPPPPNKHTAARSGPPSCPGSLSARASGLGLGLVQDRSSTRSRPGIIRFPICTR